MIQKSERTVGKSEKTKSDQLRLNTHHEKFRRQAASWRLLQ